MTSFTVIGTPKPQGSKRAYIRGGRPILTESAGAPLSDWRTDVQQAALAAHQGPPYEGPIIVELGFTLTRPKSHPKTKVTWPISRPDVDKLARACLDAMTHIVFKDDAQVIALTAVKRWGDPPGVRVKVSRGHGE